MLGAAMLIGAAVVAMVLAQAGFPRAVRVGLAVPLTFGFMGVFQAQDGTCVALAGQRMVDMDEGPTPLTDTYALAVIARQARGVWVKSLVAALLATVLAVLA
jgi:hypothetical protein